jgi:Tfp pilus assembly protein PilO
MNKADANLIYMADILLPETAESAIPIWILLLLSMTIIILLLYLWQLHRQPLNRLKRQLEQGSLSSRETAHQLAKLIPENNELRHQLDQLRFCRQAPNHTQLLNLLNKVKND